jgi:hypothetical protein
MRIVTMQPSQQFDKRRDQFMRSMESVPTQVYWSLAMGSVLFSALLYLLGRRSTALFVGQWAPTFLMLALVHKLLRPSEENGPADLQGTMD